MSNSINFGKFLRGKLKSDPQLAAMVQQETLNAEIASRIVQLRLAANMTQKELAEKIGTQQSAISRLEDGDYEGHSLNMLNKIASVFGQKVVLSFLPISNIKKTVVQTQSKKSKRLAKTPI